MLVTIIGIILAILVGGGIGFIIYKKTDNLPNAILFGAPIAGVVFMLTWFAPRLFK